MEGDERIRLFLALRLADEALDVLVAWQERELRDAGRIVPRGNVHVTLAFLGARPAGELPAILDVLGAAAAAETGAVELEVERYRETRSAGMLVLRDRTGEATRLADRLGERLEQLGVLRREQRPWLPHVTVLRYRTAPRLSPPLPELGTLVPSDAAAFLSRLHPGGARYEVLDTRSLGG